MFQQSTAWRIILFEKRIKILVISIMTQIVLKTYLIK